MHTTTISAVDVFAPFFTGTVVVFAAVATDTFVDVTFIVDGVVILDIVTLVFDVVLVAFVDDLLLDVGFVVVNVLFDVELPPDVGFVVVNVTFDVELPPGFIVVVVALFCDNNVVVVAVELLPLTVLLVSFLINVVKFVLVELFVASAVELEAIFVWVFRQIDNTDKTTK